jgi:hypothetical protein
VGSETAATDKLNGQKRLWPIAIPAPSYQLKRVDLEEQDDVPSGECGLGEYVDDEDQSLSDSDYMTIGNDIGKCVLFS